MAEAAPALSAAILELINTRATNNYLEFKQNATPEQKAARNAKYQRYREDPEFMAEKMVQVSKMFSDADVNGDGAVVADAVCDADEETITSRIQER